MVSCDVTEGITFGAKLKIPIFSLFLPHNLEVGFWYFKSLCNRDSVSNKTCQNFHDKRLVRPRSKSPNWQRSQPISYKAKFWQGYNIYLIHHKYNITYQNTRGETEVGPLFTDATANPWFVEDLNPLVTWPILHGEVIYTN